MKRLLRFLATLRDELFDLCANPIKFKVDAVIIGVTRCLEEYLIQGNVLTFFVDAIALDNRINSICDGIDSLKQRNSRPSSDSPICTAGRSCWSPCNKIYAGTRSESMVKSQWSDLCVEIGSCSRGPSECRRRACKRAATCDSLCCREIDRTGPVELRCCRVEPQIICHPSKDEPRVCERIARARQTRQRGRGRSVTYRTNPPRENWKNPRLKISIYKIILKDCHCLARLRPLRTSRLRLPCKPIYLMLEIFQADPDALESCLIVMRRKFEDGVRNACALLNNILGKVGSKAIKELRLSCEIRPGHVNFKLKSSGVGKSKVSLFVTRVSIFRDVRTYDGPRENGIYTSHALERKEADTKVELPKVKCAGVVNEEQVKEERNSECRKSNTFYSPCSNDNLITCRNLTPDNSIKPVVEGKALKSHGTDSSRVYNHRIYENDEASTAKPCYVMSHNKVANRNESVQCESRIVEYRTAETNTIVRYYGDKLDVDCNGCINNVEEIVQIDSRVTEPATRCYGTQVSRAEVRDSATDGRNHWEIVDRCSSAVYPAKSNSTDTPRTTTGSKTVSIHIIEKRADEDCSMDAGHSISSQSFTKCYKANDIVSPQHRRLDISTRFNDVLAVPIKELGLRHGTGECALKLDKTEAALRSLVSIHSGISESSSEKDYRIRRNKIRLVSRMLHSHAHSPTRTFVKTSLRYVRRARSPMHCTIRVSANSLVSIRSIRSRKEQHCPAKIEPNYSLFSRMKRRALGKSDRRKSRECRSSLKSLDDIKHLISRKLRQILSSKEDKATSTSKLVLRNSGYIISLSRGKSKQSQIICEPRFDDASLVRPSRIPKVVDRKSNSRYECECVRACRPGCKESRRKEASLNNQEKGTNARGYRISQTLKQPSFDPIQACHPRGTLREPRDLRVQSHRRNYQTLVHEYACQNTGRRCVSGKASTHSRRGNDRSIFQWNDSRKRESSPKEFSGPVSPEKHAHKEHSITEVSRQANKKYDSVYRNPKNEEHPFPSNDECFLRVSKLIGLTDTCERCMNDIEFDFRRKLSEYVALCRSAKDSLLKELREDSPYGPEVFPASCS